MLSRFPRVNLCTRKSPYEFIRVCTRGDSNLRIWPIAGTRITSYATGATDYNQYQVYTYAIINIHTLVHYNQDTIKSHRGSLTLSWKVTGAWEINFQRFSRGERWPRYGRLRVQPSLWKATGATQVFVNTSTRKYDVGTAEAAPGGGRVRRARASPTRKKRA